jgi:hypothetical protein
MNTKQALENLWGTHIRPYGEWTLILKNVWKLELADSFYGEPPKLREKKYKFTVSSILGFIIRQ